MKTASNQIAELCAPLKVGADEPVDAMAMAAAVGDDAAIRMLAAFPKLVLPAWKRPRRAMPTERRALWLWLWSGYLGGPDEPIFLDELARRSGLSVRLASIRWLALVTSGLIFPDGTLHPDATSLVSAHVAERLPKPPAEPKPKRTARTPR